MQGRQTGGWHTGWRLKAKRGRADHREVGGQAGDGQGEQPARDPSAHGTPWLAPAAFQWFDRMTLHTMEFIDRFDLLFSIFGTNSG
jgi:hypothetical protein